MKKIRIENRGAMLHLVLEGGGTLKLQSGMNEVEESKLKLVNKKRAAELFKGKKDARLVDHGEVKEQPKPEPAPDTTPDTDTNNDDSGETGDDQTGDDDDQTGDDDSGDDAGDSEPQGDDQSGDEEGQQ